MNSDSKGKDTQNKTRSRVDEEKIKVRSKIVCICNGINLGRILPILDECEFVADVNNKAGTGSGGCQGQRCGPRIKLLLKKNAERKSKQSSSS